MTRRRRRRQEEAEEEEQEEEEATDIKSNNPHLAGGEKSAMVHSNYTQKIGTGQKSKMVWLITVYFFTSPNSVVFLEVNSCPIDRFFDFCLPLVVGSCSEPRNY